MKLGYFNKTGKL